MTEHDIDRIFRGADSMAGAWKHPPQKRQRWPHGAAFFLFLPLGIFLWALLALALVAAEPEITTHPDCPTEAC